MQVGTAFFVAVPSKAFPGRSFVYLVTAHHNLLDEDRKPREGLLLTLEDSKTSAMREDPLPPESRWVLDPIDEKADVAAIPLTPNGASIAPIPLALAARQRRSVRPPRNRSAGVLPDRRDRRRQPASLRGARPLRSRLGSRARRHRGHRRRACSSSAISTAAARRDFPAALRSSSAPGFASRYGEFSRPTLRSTPIRFFPAWPAFSLRSSSPRPCRKMGEVQDKTLQGSKAKVPE